MYVEGGPNIFYAMTELSKPSENPVYCHYVSLKRMVRHLRKDPEKGIIW